jgi:hypothetical protein
VELFAPSVAASPWDAREAMHVRNAVFGAALRDDPSPYLYVENVFTAATYATMLEHFPPDDALRPWDAQGLNGSYDRRYEINLPREAARLSAADQAFWLGAAAYLLSADFARLLFERFAPYARARFGEAFEDPAFVRDRLRSTLILNQHDAGYYLGPHTDRHERVFTALFYFPERAGFDHLGTTLYRPLEHGFACSGVKHHDPAKFEARETVPYRPNSVLIFPKSDVLFHGVQPLTAEQLCGSRRRGMQVQFLLHNERPRASCRTTLRAVIPEEMRAADELTISLRLTNRAAVVLDSDFPYQTQLGYRWYDERGRELDPDVSVRSPLPRAIPPGQTVPAAMRVVAPSMSGRYALRLSLVQEGVAWFDDIDPSNGIEVPVRVSAPASAVESPDPPAAGDALRDIVPPSGDVALGEGWYPLERAGETVFRWVEGRALVHVAALRPVRHVLHLAVEPGPGVGLAPFPLTASLADGRELGTATVAGKQTVRFDLPPESPSLFSVALSASGGGRTSAADPRVLDFRVFAVAVERIADVFPSWAVPAAGFHPLERDGAETFRWIGGEAIVELHPSRRDRLEFDAESGPGMRSRPFRLRVVRPDGTELVDLEVGTRTRVVVPLAISDRVESIVLRADGGGVTIASDPRNLDFRVFAPRL